MRKPRKRGIVQATLIKFIIVLAALALFSSMFFIGSGGLYNRIKSAFPNPNEHVGRDTYQNPKYDARPQQDNAESVFDEVHKGFKELANDTAQRCFYYIPNDLPYDEMFGDYKIVIEPTADRDGISLQLQHDKEGHNPVTSQKKILAADNPSMNSIRAGVVHGEAAKKFYYNYLDEDVQEETSYEPKAGDCKSLDTTLEIADEELRYQDEEYDWETEKGADGDGEKQPGPYVIYKSEDTICMVPTVDGSWKCKVRDGLFRSLPILDDDCFQWGADDSLYELVKTNSNAYVWDERLQKCVAPSRGVSR